MFFPVSIFKPRILLEEGLFHCYFQCFTKFFKSYKWSKTLFKVKNEYHVCSNRSTLMLKCTTFFNLNELRNHILRIILVWSLFCLMQVYVGLHFLQFLLENDFFVFLWFLLCFLFWIKCFESRHRNMFWCYVILFSLYKNSPSGYGSHFAH